MSAWGHARLVGGHKRVGERGGVRAGVVTPRFFPLSPFPRRCLFSRGVLPVAPPTTSRFPAAVPLLPPRFRAASLTSPSPPSCPCGFFPVLPPSFCTSPPLRVLSVTFPLSFCSSQPYSTPVLTPTPTASLSLIASASRPSSPTRWMPELKLPAPGRLRFRKFCCASLNTQRAWSRVVLAPYPPPGLRCSTIP